MASSVYGNFQSALMYDREKQTWHSDADFIEQEYLLYHALQASYTIHQTPEAGRNQDPVWLLVVRLHDGDIMIKGFNRYSEVIALAGH